MNDEPQAPPDDAAPAKGTKAPKSGGTTSSGASGAKSGSSSKKKSGGSRKSLKQPLEDTITSIGLLVSPVDAHDGRCIIGGAGELADSLDQVARQDARVHRALTRITSGSAWGGVAVASMSIILPIAAHHGLLPSAVVESAVGGRADTDSTETSGATLGAVLRAPSREDGPEQSGGDDQAPEPDPAAANAS